MRTSFPHPDHRTYPIIPSESLRTAASYSEIPDDALSVYIAFRAAEIFFTEAGRYPGTESSDLMGEADIPAMLLLAARVLATLEGGEVDEELTNVIHEV